MVRVKQGLKRLAILIVSLVVGFFGGGLISSGYSSVSNDHMFLNMWLITLITVGLLSGFFETGTKVGSYIYWTWFGLWVVLLFIHEFILWPTGQCMIGPCY